MYLDIGIIDVVFLIIYSYIFSSCRIRNSTVDRVLFL